LVKKKSVQKTIEERSNIINPKKSELDRLKEEAKKEPIIEGSLDEYLDLVKD
jgi:hypothetical protein